MHRALRHTARASAALLALASLGFGAATAQARTAPPAVAPAAVPAPPAGDELHANADSSITITWPASPGATSYNLYRGTSSGGEGTTPIATTTATTYTDQHLSPTPIYFYQITAVNSSGESARTPEDASKTPPPIGTGGTTAGVSNGAGGLVYYCKDALLGGFDWFQTLTGWFPQDLGSSGSNSPTQQVVDMAYASAGTMSFTNVAVPTAGLYTIDWRYAFQGGLFPGVNNRQMGLEVNGTVITTTQRFPITGSFDVYQHTALQVHLNAGANTVTMLAVSDHGVSRVDQLTVTPATASVPSGPTNLTATPGAAAATLHWTASASGNPTSYTIYRGTISDGEAVTPVGTVTGATTTFTDTGLTNGKTYFYNVAASNAVGVSPDSNEVSTVPAAAPNVPAAPTGLSAVPGNAAVTLTWNASAGATSYNIYRGTAAGAESGTALATSTTPTYTDTTAANGTTYFYYVTATNTAGTSGKSNEASATPSATAGTLLSQGHPATASSLENAGLTAANAVDGNTGTRWSSAFSDPQWLQVDLGATHNISQVALNWEAAYAKAFQIQTSNDGTTWTTIYSTTTSTGGIQTIPISGGSGRYVRMYGTQRATGYGYSLWEFQVFGS